MLRRLLVVLCALAVAGALMSAEARKRRHHHHHGDWEQLVIISEQDVDLSVDNFKIDVSMAKGAYKGIRVRNARGQLFDLSRVQVTYSDGSTHDENRQIDMYQGERSRPINPTYESRFIDLISITQVPGYGRGRLQILGIQDAEGRRMDRRGGTASYPPSFERPSSSSGDLTTRPTSDRPSERPVMQPSGDGEVLFGALYVGFTTDRDVIRIGNEIGKFQRIRFRVLDNDIFINEIRVVYANGEADTLAVNAEIPRNSRTNWIDLKGDRFIREIQLVYRSRPSFRGQARVEVYGQYADNWLGPEGEGRKYNQGWVLLGAQTAGFVGFDRDVIPVGRNEGGFKRVRVSVRDRAITLNELKIFYTDGVEETIPVRTRVDAGGTYGPIDLKGERRQRIDHIEARYRSRIFSAGKGSAIVEVWAQH